MRGSRNAETQALLAVRDGQRSCTLHEGIGVNRAHSLVLGSRAGIALQHLATQECLLRLFEVRSGECDSNRQSRRQEIPQDAAADCTFFPKPEQAG
jgi:hypothetical protein